VAAGGERGQHLPELGERHRDVRARRLRDDLGSCGHELGRLCVAAHRGDERDRRVGGGCPLRFPELLGETPGFLGRGHRHVAVADTGGHARVERQQPRQMPQSSLRPQSVDRRREEVVAQVERADDERGRPEEASGIRVEPLVSRRAAQTREHAGRVTQRVRIRVDREHSRVFSIRISQATRGVDERPSHVGTGIDPPSA
jgi:hypothetical protein